MMTKAQKIEILKVIINELRAINFKSQYGLGIRAETPENEQIRSKTIRAFLVDFFDDTDKDIKDLLDILEEQIDINVRNS